MRPRAAHVSSAKTSSPVVSTARPELFDDRRLFNVGNRVICPSRPTRTSWMFVPEGFCCDRAKSVPLTGSAARASALLSVDTSAATSRVCHRGSTGTPPQRPF
jgi:hypothetical protein